MSYSAAVRPAAFDRVLFGGIFLLSFGTLLFELALIRVFSFTIWHHFAYVVLSTALLGYGAAGTFLAVRPSFGASNLRSTLVRCSWISAVSVLGVLLFVSLAPLHPMSILEEPRQAVLFVAYPLAATIPFFFSGLVVSLALRAASDRVDRLYFWDLLGAGLGCACAIGIMDFLAPPGAAVVSAAVFAAAAVVFSTRRARRVGLVVVGALALASGFAAEIPLTPARSKELTLLRIAEFEPSETKWTSLFRTDLLEYRGDGTESSPSRFWGLSRTAPSGMELPLFYVSHDGTAGTGIYDLRHGHELKHLDYHVLKFPYLVANPDPRVLVIGVGGGRDVIAARQYGASHVTGVELDPLTVEIVRDQMREVSDGFFRQPEVELVAAEGRHFIRKTEERFDLIQLTGVDTLSAMYTGAFVLAENYLYTVEALADFLDRLRPGGILSIATGNLNVNHPRAAGRMVSLAQRALRERGIERPKDYIAVVNSGSLLVEIMVRTLPYERWQIERLAETAAELEFQPLLLPGRDGHPIFERLVSTTGAERERLLSSLRYHIPATTDDNPFFFSFFRWTDLFEPGRITPSHVTALGQIVLGLLLVSLTVLGAAFILVPLFFFRRRRIGAGRAAKLGIVFYFLSIGLGFMLFEISLIQKFVLFLGYPTYSLSVTLGSLLVFLGWGSYVSRRWVGRERVVLPLGVLAMAGLTALYIKGLPALQGYFLTEPLLTRAVVTGGVLAPLGLLLGMFFPLGIREASRIHADLVPWAWGINGCASVTGGVLTVVLAMSFGFTAVWILSVVVYALGVAAVLLAGRKESRDFAAE